MFAARNGRVATFILKNSPLTDAEVVRLVEIADRLKFGVVYAPVTPSHQTPSHRNEYTWLITTDDPERFYRLFPWDITPTTDDRPFFFQNKRLRDEMTIKFDRSMLFGGGFDTLRTVSLVSVTLVVLFILLPLAGLSPEPIGRID